MAGKPSCHYCWYADQVRPDSETRVQCAGPGNSNTSLSATDRDVMRGAEASFLASQGTSKQVQTLKCSPHGNCSMIPKGSDVIIPTGLEH